MRPKNRRRPGADRTQSGTTPRGEFLLRLAGRVVRSILYGGQLSAASTCRLRLSVRDDPMRRPPHPLVRRPKHRLPADQRPPALYRLRSAAVEAIPAGPDVRDAQVARLDAVLVGAVETLHA